MKHLRALGFKGTIAVTAHSASEGNALVQAGADHALLPYPNQAEHAADQTLGWLGAGRQA